MTRVLLIIFGSLLVYGCAAVNEPVAETVSATPMPAPQEYPVDDAQSDSASTSTEVASSTDEEVAIPSMEPPPVERSDLPIVVSNKNERICRRERRTGSNRAVRVCYTRAELERLEQEGKDTFRELHRSQMGEK